MKQNRLFLIVAAALSLAACTKLEVSPQESGGEARTFTFIADFDGGSSTKAVLEKNAGGKPQVFWENGDQITVYTQASGDSGTQKGFEFITSLGQNAASASFSYTGDDFAEGNYLAIFPAATAGRAVNFTGTDEVYKMAAVDVPSSQTLPASGGFDKNACVMTAYATSGSKALHFKNAVALLKFRVSGSGITSGSIVAANGDLISGRFRADLNISAPYEPVLTAYNQPEFCYVDFAAEGGEALSEGVDYYVAVRPTALAEGFKVYLNDNLVKTVSAAELARGTVYNLGSLSLPAGPKSKVLTFDFTGDPLEGWPTDQNKNDYPHVEGGVEYTYPLDGTDYTFVLADCGTATNTAAQLFWHTNTHALVFNAQKRYLGFPAIAGYKLTKVVCLNKSGTTTAKFEMVKSISPTTDDPAESEIVSPAQVWSTKGISYTYYLSGTKANTRYYQYCMVKGSVGKFTLIYEPE